MQRSEVETMVAPRRGNKRKFSRRFALVAIVICAVTGAVVLLAHAGSFLVLDAPERADVLLVLGGGDDMSRLGHAVVLHRQGYAGRILLDADITREIYGRTEVDLVSDFLHRTNQDAVEICPTVGHSTYDEAADVQRCMQRLHASSALIVTSDFHTRRAIAIFRKRLPQYHWSVAAASSPYHYAEQYWKYRAWAKTVLDEWEKYLWWKLVDEWRSDLVLPSSEK